MKLPNQSAGVIRIPVTKPYHSSIVAAQLMRRAIPRFDVKGFGVTRLVAPRPCEDCDLLFLACRAAEEPDSKCTADYIECGITCY